MKKMVFVSYRHTSPEFDDSVRELVAWLQQLGHVAVVDFDAPDEGRTWWAWSRDAIHAADWVLVVCNRGYRESWDKPSENKNDGGKGSAIEAGFIVNLLAQTPGKLGKVRFVFMAQGDKESVPQECVNHRHYHWWEETHREDLARTLQGSVSVPSPAAEQQPPIPKWAHRALRPSNPEEDRYARHLLEAGQRLKERTRTEAERKVRQRVVNIMGTLTERFGATSSWLFLKSPEAATAGEGIAPGDKIRLEYSHNTGIRELEVVAGEAGQGIVSHVAATGRPYLANDAKDDPRYRDSVKSTLSELAVPIVHRDALGKDPLIGVFNLESNRPDAFLEAHVGELMAAATEFAPEILVHQFLRRSPEAFGWHPASSGWTLERLLDDFCGAISAPADTAQGPPPGPREKLPRPSCTVWYLDPDEKRLYVRGTARFDYEYVNRRGLGPDSFTGKVARLPAGHVGCGQPERLLDFQRRRKSEDMGMVLAFAAPIYLPATPPGGAAVGTINLYFFAEELSKANEDVSHLEAQFPEWVVLCLAEALGRLIDETQRLRIEVAAAYFRYRQHEHALPGLTDFATLQEVILSCLDADSCSIFAREVSEQAGKNGTLRCLTTTGLRRYDGTSVDLDDIFYDLDDPDEQGIAAHLAEKPYRTLRCRSIVDLRTRPNPELQVLKAVNKYRETYSHTDTEHRPFLGISVDDPYCDPPNPPTGIVRVLRRSGSKPFVHTDETLLRRIIRDGHFVFHCWRMTRRARQEQEQPAIRGARFPFLVRVVGNAIPSPKLDAMGHLGSEFIPGAIWNRRQVDAMLLDLINLFRNGDRGKGRQGGLIANFRLAQPSPDPRQTRIFALHAPLSSDPPPEETVWEYEKYQRSIGMTAINQRRATTFDKKCPIFRRILKESDDVLSGACMPVRFLSERGTVWGVLSMDCDDLEFEEWTQEHLLVLALAAKKLDFVGRDNLLRDEEFYCEEGWGAALSEFLKRLMTKKEMEMEACNLQTANGSQVFYDLPKNKQERLDWATTGMEDFAAEPVPMARWSEHRGFDLELKFGAFNTGLRLRGCFHKFKDEARPIREAMAARIVQITQLWNRFTNSRVGVGVTPLFSLTFTPGSQIDGIRHWTEQVQLAPDVFARDPLPFPHLDPKGS